MEEQIEQALRRETVGVSAKILQFLLAVVYQVGKFMARSGWKVTRAMGRGVENMVYKSLHEGKVSEKTLQRDSNGNIHQTKAVSQKEYKAIKKSLDKTGAKYAVEKIDGKDGQQQYIIHFRGEDYDHIAHAIDRAGSELKQHFNIMPAKQTEEQTPQAPTKGANNAMTAEQIIDNQRTRDFVLPKPTPVEGTQRNNDNTSHAKSKGKGKKIDRKDVIKKVKTQTQKNIATRDKQTPQAPTKNITPKR